MNPRFEDFQKLKSGCTTTSSAFYPFLYGMVGYLKPKTVVEIGVNFGLSSIIMGLAMKEFNIDGHIYSFDISEKYLTIAKRQIEQMELQDKITLFFGDSNEVKKLNIKKFDLIFIDGDHSYKGAKEDYENLKNIGKYFLFHDVNVNDVKMVVDESNEFYVNFKNDITEQTAILERS